MRGVNQKLPRESTSATLIDSGGNFLLTPLRHIYVFGTLKQEVSEDNPYFCRCPGNQRLLEYMLFISRTEEVIYTHNNHSIIPKKSNVHIKINKGQELQNTKDRVSVQKVFHFSPQLNPDVYKISGQYKKGCGDKLRINVIFIK